MECLDKAIGRGGPCVGEVFERRSPSGASMIAWCDRHEADAWDRKREIDRQYPKQAPSWFDPSYAGEHWDEDY